MMGSSSSRNTSSRAASLPEAPSTNSDDDGGRPAAAIELWKVLPRRYAPGGLGKAGALVPYDGVLGTTADGVVAYSNGNDGHWSATKHHDANNLFMGYRWQCVEFARRWLWQTKGLYLPSKNCAYSYAGMTSVRRPTPAPVSGEGGADQGLSAVDYANVTWKKASCTYHAQGSRTPPAPASLIIYPMSFGSPWGHIGVIVNVDLSNGIVYVADQNRYFRRWVDGKGDFSATFWLDCVDGRYYIRDPESECKGWLAF